MFLVPHLVLEELCCNAVCGCYLSQGITLASSQAVSNARKLEWPLSQVAEGVFETEAPGGYKFYLQDRSLPQSGNYTGQAKAWLRVRLRRVGGRGAQFLLFCSSSVLTVCLPSQCSRLCSGKLNPYVNISTELQRI